MKHKHINFKNLVHFLPGWICDQSYAAKSIDRLLDHDHAHRGNWTDCFDFWIEASLTKAGWEFALKVPDGTEDKILHGHVVFDTEHHQLRFPVNDILRERESLNGTHCAYIHGISGINKQYIGITKNRWYERYAQHRASAKRGSSLLFHKALMDCWDQKISHYVVLSGFPYEEIMQYEEDFVLHASLYPKGLNMIPGGFAGIRYLHKLGILGVKTSEDRDRRVESLANDVTLNGKANPLCAARWASDQDYINSVICGHSDRLSVDQVRSIRMLSDSGSSPEEIAKFVGDSEARVKRVASGSRYARVA